MNKKTIEVMVKRIEKGELEVLAKVNGFEDITFAHILMAESIMSALNVDSSFIMEEVKKIKRERQSQ